MGLFLQLLSLSFTLAQSHVGCFEQHLREARALNSERSPLYSELTNGESKKVSNLLIGGEYFAEFLARRIDRESATFVPYGVDLTCESFVSMSSAPKFKPHRSPVPHLQNYRELDLSEFKSRAKKMTHAGAWAELSDLINREIKELEAIPEFHCMTRHILESAHKIARQAPLQIEHLKTKKAPKDISPLIQKLILNHLRLLTVTELVDDWAAPIQATGVAIVCQDVPNLNQGWKTR